MRYARPLIPLVPAWGTRLDHLQPRGLPLDENQPLMSLTVKEIEKQALALPVKKRAQLVDKLWESLGNTTHPVLSEEWQAEIERRRREVLE